MVNANKTGFPNQFEGLHGSSFIVGHALRQRAVQEQALAAAERRRMLKAAGLPGGSLFAAFRNRRMATRIGGVMIRIGNRLQGVNAATMPPASELC